MELAATFLVNKRPRSYHVTTPTTNTAADSRVGACATGRAVEAERGAWIAVVRRRV